MVHLLLATQYEGFEAVPVGRARSGVDVHLPGEVANAGRDEQLPELAPARTSHANERGIRVTVTAVQVIKHDARNFGRKLETAITVEGHERTVLVCEQTDLVIEKLVGTAGEGPGSDILPATHREGTIPKDIAKLGGLRGIPVAITARVAHEESNHRAMDRT
eukprot:13257994-Heterocapsa_arctica.AAC.1